MESLQILTLHNAILDTVKSEISKRKPILIKNWDIGPCIHKWNCEYVSNKVGSEPVKVHVSENKKLNFINKNFIYKTLPFNELIKRIFSSNQTEYFISPNELYYLRSLGKDPRGKDAANFLDQCSQLAEDLKIPQFYNEVDYFSSVFRASSQGLQLWTHYDIMDNILLQIRGFKRVILWPPSEINNLYLRNDKSEVLEIDYPDIEKFPKFLNAARYECVLEPGDILFIPALWFHNTIALEPSLGLNVFWKNLSHEFYDKNDSYGNKDLVLGAKGLHSIEAINKSLKVLPKDYKNFYIRRMIQLLEDSLNE